MEYLERSVEVGGREWRYVEAGDGDPLIWLHGGFGLHPTAGIDLLAESFRVIAIELPGFGSSVEHQTASSFDELAEEVAGAIEALGLTDFLLLGTSFGGAVALQLALNHPDRVSRLILESPAAFRPPGWTPPDAETLRRGLLRHPERARRVQIDPALMKRQREVVNRMSLAVDREVLAARLRGLHVPVLVVFGDSDTLTPPELARLYSENAPDCESIVISDAAHVISSDQAEAYATTVRSFAMGERTSP